MHIFKGKYVQLTAAVLMSLMLHIAVIAGLSGAGFKIGDLLLTKPFYAKIISEPSLKKPIKKHSTHKLQDTLSASDTFAEQNEEEKPENKTVLAAQNDIGDAENYQGEDTPLKTEDEVLADSNPANILNTEREQPLHASVQSEHIMILKSLRERLYFDIYWLGIYVGNATLEAVNNSGTVKISSQVHSAPVISAFYKVEDYAESRLENGIPSFFKIKQREGRKRSNKETFFDMDNKKLIHINHIKGTKDEHSINTKNLWDVMSGFYYLRTQDLNVGETVYINIFDSNKFYQAEVQVLKKERVRLFNDSEIDSIVVKPVLKSEGLFQNKGDISIWLTDDENKIPVRVETEVPIGKVVAEIKAIETEKEK
jgi:hypothetical protein